jgi:hypothetical protein
LPSPEVVSPSPEVVSTDPTLIPVCAPLDLWTSKAVSSEVANLEVELSEPEPAITSCPEPRLFWKNSAY